MYRLLILGLVAAVCLSGKVADGETFDDLKGLSVEVIWTQHATYFHPPENKFYTEYQNWALRAYVSSKGNIFHNRSFADRRNLYQSFLMTQLDKAMIINKSHGLLYTWTMIDGHLTKIEQMLEGFTVMTVAIDPVALTCTFRVEDTPDARTGYFWTYRSLDGTPALIRDRTVDNYTCKVTRGNVFEVAQ